MSIYREKNLSETHSEIVNVADKCFYCGEVLKLPAVFWCGFPADYDGSGYIWFHPRCAEKFAMKLLTDAENL